MDKLDAPIAVSSSGRQQKNVLGPIDKEKKMRDKARKREQAKRRKAIEKEVQRQALARQFEANKSTLWHREQRREEGMINKYTHEHRPSYQYLYR
jgi:hypothetical protein